jgi:hypothetical protein
MGATSGRFEQAVDLCGENIDLRSRQVQQRESVGALTLAAAPVAPAL